ncbi:hypothetical protein CROQUDRAFT_665624 [Cronartium quercuum f. sp. fusiforme G11]|uniref:Uncharacterized protein n=1 Tax=Cronartium quercuum f. sp. fusiforme G11 TaxID=708437 RepID=A0A9P6N9X8_9BASI|nr:hypothetical protein CROQUDRAFT_665624 [Cronartium quercuum f. sp. fusiforme G11]
MNNQQNPALADQQQPQTPRPNAGNLGKSRSAHASFSISWETPSNITSLSSSISTIMIQQKQLTEAVQHLANSVQALSQSMVAPAQIAELTTGINQLSMTSPVQPMSTQPIQPTPHQAASQANIHGMNATTRRFPTYNAPPHLPFPNDYNNPTQLPAFGSPSALPHQHGLHMSYPYGEVHERHINMWMEPNLIQGVFFPGKSNEL